MFCHYIRLYDGSGVKEKIYIYTRRSFGEGVFYSFFPAHKCDFSMNMPN